MSDAFIKVPCLVIKDLCQTLLRRRARNKDTFQGYERIVCGDGDEIQAQQSIMNGMLCRIINNIIFNFTGQALGAIIDILSRLYSTRHTRLPESAIATLRRVLLLKVFKFAFIVEEQTIMVAVTGNGDEKVEETSGNSRTEDSVESKNPSNKISEVLSSRSVPGSKLDREEYERRLVTFQASTFYAKPTCLSPLFCARFGWKNADKDMLVCTSCSAALAITLNSKLSAKTFDKLCHAYRSKIVSCHERNCPFRLSSVEKLQSLENVEDENATRGNDESEYHVCLTVPIYMGQVLPEDCVKLMEHPKPSGLLKQNAKKLMGSIDNPSVWRYPSLQIPPKIRQMDTNAALTRLTESDSQTILALSILGWNPIPKHNTNKSNVVSLGCPCCLSIMDLELERKEAQTYENKETSKECDGSDSSEPDRVTKRQRMNSRKFNPLEAHRHYCPFKVGFPKTSTDANPIWKLILERLSKEHHDQQVESAEANEESVEREEVAIGALDKSIENVRRILRSGIARNKAVLST